MTTESKTKTDATRRSKGNSGMSNITDHQIVSHEEWIAERKALLAKEKEFNRLRDELSARRRALPWERVTKKYVFDGPRGAETLERKIVGRIVECKEVRRDDIDFLLSF